jgi:hypothetical protein
VAGGWLLVAVVILVFVAVPITMTVAVFITVAVPIAVAVTVPIAMTVAVLILMLVAMVRLVTGAWLLATAKGLFAAQVLIIHVFQHLVQCGGVVPTVVGQPQRDIEPVFKLGDEVDAP